MPNLITQITPPRVDFLDPRTGKVSREWYMFFLSLYQVSGGSDISILDLQVGGTAPPLAVIGDELAEFEKDTDRSLADIQTQITSLQKQVKSDRVLLWLSM